MNSNSVLVTVNSALGVSVAPVGPLTLSAGQIQTFTATVSGGTGSKSYQWYLDGGVVAGQTASTYSYTGVTSGSPHSVYVRVTDSASTPVSVNSNSVLVTVNSALGVSVAPVGPLTLDAGQIQTFTATVSGGTGSKSYQWYLDGGVVAGQTASTYSYTGVTSGSPHSVYVRVTDSASTPVSVNSNSVLVTVNSALGVSVAPVGPLTLSAGQIQTFTATVSGGTGSKSYQWYLDGGVVAGQTASTYSYTGVTSGSPHSVYVRVTDSASTPVSVNSNSVLVTVNSALGVSVAPVGPLTLDAGQIQTFTATVSGGTGSKSYQWYLDGGVVAGQTASTYSYTGVTSGSPHSVYVRVTDSASTPVSVNSNSVLVTVNSALGVSVAPVGPLTLGAGQIQTFTATVSGGTGSKSYQWYLDGGVVAGQTASTYSYTGVTSGSPHSVYVRVTDSASTPVSVNSNSVLVTVNSALGVSVAPVGPLTLSAGQIQTFTATVSGGTGSKSYQWYLDGGVVAGQTASTYSYTGVTSGSPHSVYVRVTDSASTPVSVNSNSVLVTVNSALGVSLSPMSPLNLVLNQVQVFTATASGGVGTLSYQWYLDDSAVSGQTSSTYTYMPVLGSHGVQVNVTDSASPLVTVRSNLVIFTVNSAGFAARLVVSSGASQGSGISFPVTVTARDAYNNDATSYNGIVKFTSSDSQALLPANGALRNGVGIFNVTLRTIGYQSVTVTDTVVNSITGSQVDILVNLVSGVTFVVSGFPSSSIAGVVQSVTVTAKDVNNNLVTSYSGTVRFTSSDSQAVLPVDVGLINGVGSFSVTLKTAGIQSITVTDATVGSIDGSQTGITVKPAALDHFSILVPGAVTAGTTFGGVAVTAYDVYNNVKTDYAGSVYFTCSDSAAILPYTSPSRYLFVSGDNGVHIFSGFILKSTSSQSISVTDGIISKQSASITVNNNIPGQPTPTPTPTSQVSPTVKPVPSNSSHVSPSPLPSGFNLNSDLMVLPLSFLDISLFFAFLSIILLPTSKLLPRYYQMVTPLIHKLEVAAVLVSVLFLLTVAIQVAMAILNI